MAEELLRRAEQAVELALAAGADDAIAATSRSRALEFQWRDGRLEKVKEDTSRSLGVAIYVDGRYSRHGTNDLDPRRLAGFMREAVALTRLLEVDPYRRIPDPALYEGRADLDLELVDASLAGLTREQRVDWCRVLADRAGAHEEVISATSGVGDSHAVSARVSSNGFRGTAEATSVSWGAEVTIADGDVKRPEASRWVGGSHLDGLPGPEETGAEALRRALARKGAAKVPSTRTAMIVDREAGAGLLGRVFGALSAGAIQQKQSFLAGMLDRPIASELLTVTDEPFIPRLLGSRLWDGEGISTRPRTLIDHGVLRTCFVDTYYGRKLGLAPTTGGASNLVFRHGDAGLDGLLERIGQGIYVDSWLGGNANLTTGDFSFGLRGHVVRGGALAEPVAEMNVTGNYRDLLQRLVAVGNDPVPWASFRTPTLVFDGVEFSGS